MAAPRTPFICARCTQSLRPRSRALTTAAPSRGISNVKGTSAPAEDLPRWKQTPPAMKMPIRLRPEPPNQPRWDVNTRDEPVNQAYDRFIGDKASAIAAGQQGMNRRDMKGSELLDEEIKWLALTHKSFDHGRRGFNDRLAYLGKRILDLQASLALLSTAPMSSSTTAATDSNIFQHPSLHGLENITPLARNEALNKTRVARVAYTYGLDKVVRWKPKKSDRLEGSGIESVLAQTVYAIIGALALQRGGEVAARVAKERVLGPLGLKAYR